MGSAIPLSVVVVRSPLSRLWLSSHAPPLTSMLILCLLCIPNFQALECPSRFHLLGVAAASIAYDYQIRNAWLLSVHSIHGGNVFMEA